MEPAPDAPEISVDEILSNMKDNMYARFCISQKTKRVWCQRGNLDELIKKLNHPDFHKLFSGVGSLLCNPGTVYFYTHLEHVFFPPLSDHERLLIQFYIHWKDQPWSLAFIPRELDWCFDLTAISSGLSINSSQPGIFMIDRDGGLEYHQFPIQCHGLTDRNPNAPHLREREEIARLIQQGVVSPKEAMRRIQRFNKSEYMKEIDRVNELGRKLGFPEFHP